MGKLTAQMQMYIAIGVIAVAVVAFVALAIVPKFQEAAAVDTEIQTAEMELQTAQALLARRQGVKAQAAQNEAGLMSIANQIPDSPLLPSLVIELQEVANASGVTLGQITPGGVNAPVAGADGTVPLYGTVPITLTVTGEWSDTIDFARRLGKMQRGLRVLNSAMSYVPATSTDGGAAQGGVVQVNVSAEGYVM